MAATITRPNIKSSIDNVTRNCRFDQGHYDISSEMEALAAKLFGKPSWRTKTEMRYGSKGSLSIDLSKGTFFDHEAGQGGGVLDLIERETGLKGREAATWLGLDDPNWKPKINRSEKSDCSADNAKKAEFAKRIWSESQPAENTPVREYLLGRGLDMPIPPTVRYNPAVLHVGTGLHLPCMVSAVTRWPSREIVAIHRTYLCETSRGWEKAKVSSPKMALGSVRGGAVRLGPIAGDILAVVEGLEDGLALSAMTGLPVWAVLSTGNFCPILPDDIETVLLAPDGDIAGDEAAKRAAVFLAGKTVRRIPIPSNRDCADLYAEFQERMAIAGDFDRITDVFADVLRGANHGEV